MFIVFIISFRNLLKHKGKSIIIGTIIFIGASIMTIGNAVISGMDRGLKQNIVDSFTGSIFIVATNQKFDMVLFPPYGKDVEMIYGYTNIREILKKQDYIKQFTPVARGNGLILSEKGDIGFCMLMGVKFDEYYSMFSNVNVIEGRLLTNNEKGLLLTEVSRNRIYNNQNFWAIPVGCKLNISNLSERVKSNINSINELEIRSNVVFMGYGPDGSGDINSDIIGIIKYKKLNNLWENYNFIDIESFRICFNFLSVENIATNIKSNELKLLSLEDDNLDFLFREDQIVNLKNTDFSEKNIKKLIKRKENKNYNIGKDIDIGGYNMVLIKLKDNIKLEKALKKLNTELSNNNAGGRAISWKKAVGQIADIATIIRGALFGFVFFLFFVAAIVIMNTLSMSAIERTTEIAMMRAIGARKSFIASMFIIETAILSFIFGLGGIFFGSIATFITAKLNITTTNQYLQLLFGGDVFQPYLGLIDYLLCLIQLIIVTIISVIYPIRIATKISPLEAIARE